MFHGAGGLARRPPPRPDMHAMSWPVKSARFERKRVVTAPDPFDPPIAHPDRIVVS